MTDKDYVQIIEALTFSLKEATSTINRLLDKKNTEE